MSLNDENEELNKKMLRVLGDLKKTKVLKITSDNTGVSQSEIYSWISNEKAQNEPFSSFKREFNKIFQTNIPKITKKNLSKSKKRERRKKYKKNISKHFEQEKCDGFAKKHISRKEIAKDSNQEIVDLMNLACKYELDNNFDVAINYCDEIISRYPDYVDAYNKKGNCLLKLDFYEESIDCFNLSLSLSKNNYDAHIGLSYALYNILVSNDLLSRNQVFDYEMQILINLNTAAILNKEALFLKSKIFKELGNYKESLDSLNEYIKFYTMNITKSIQSKKSREILHHKAELNLVFNNYASSYYIFDELLKFDKDNGELLYNQALIAITLNKFNKALYYLDKILKENPNDIEVNLLKGELLVSLHRYDEAIIYFKRCKPNEIPSEYIKLMDYAYNMISSNFDTDYYSTTLTNFSNFNFVYTYISNGFRQIYGVDLNELKEKVLKNNLVWHNIKYDDSFNDAFEVICKYIIMYDFDVDYNELLSGLINADFLKKVFTNDFSLNQILNSYSGFEKEIMEIIIKKMKFAVDIAKKRNYTGYFGVIERNGIHGNWSYLDLFKMNFINRKVIYADSLEELEMKVKSENSFWFIFDEDLAKKSRDRDKNLNS